MLTANLIEPIVRAALTEDAPWGDLTCATVLPPSSAATADLVARTDGVLAGEAVFTAAFTLTDPAVQVTMAKEDGEYFAAGDALARVQGPAGAVLQAERIALNLTQRLSAIATATSRYVAAVAGTGVRIADTRKTTPGMRVLERHAVRAGGGHNHRFGLSDAVMLKDNHLAVLGAAGQDLTEALRRVRRRLGHTVHMEVEVDRLDQIDAVLAAEVDTIMLDNFSLDHLRQGVALIDGRAIVEASGNVTLDTVTEIAATGVDVISVGALTHSVAALDLGLDVQVAP
ncbi:carboxylating nicotinate-nucleotide diphosphorylase [Pseudactinotalea sp. Z1739]|uniref:carboxylating nicotinate-nucleotide diphosphorylase n=1 Tax=Pseudactinotalea sp. Z1739 TaxID=3413028 RepID=UPI003C7D2964